MKKRTGTGSILAKINEVVRRGTGVTMAETFQDELEGILSNAFSQSYQDENAEEFTDREVTILLADLRGFTSITATYPAGTVIEILNRCLSRLSEVVFRHQGVIDKFMGDSIMVLFGAPVTRPDDVQRALHCAIEMQFAMQTINQMHRSNGLPELYMGIGINTGNVMAGTIGTKAYSEYTVIGDEVNLASRIEAFTLRGQVLISQTTYERSKGFVIASDAMQVHVKGKNKPVALRELLAIPSLGLEVPRQEIRRSHRIGVSLPLSYWVVQNKIVMPERIFGTVCDVGYYGILAQVDREMPIYSEVKLEFELPLVGFHVTDLYAKVVNMKSRDGQLFAGLEFTSVTADVNMNIQMFTQLLIMKE